MRSTFDGSALNTDCALGNGFDNKMRLDALEDKVDSIDARLTAVETTTAPTRKPTSAPTKNPTQARNKQCLRITTGTGGANDGTLNVQVNSGNGYTNLVTGNTNYGKGSQVVRQCFANGITGVKVRNPTNNAWTGSVQHSSDESSWKPFTCTSCTAGSDSSHIVVDGNGDGAGQAGTRCLNGNTCTLAL